MHERVRDFASKAWHRLLPTAGERERRRDDGSQLRRGAHEGELRALRRALGARVRRWPEAYRITVLHELGVAEFRGAGQDLGFVKQEISGVRKTISESGVVRTYYWRKNRDQYKNR